MAKKKTTKSSEDEIDNRSDEKKESSEKKGKDRKIEAVYESLVTRLKTLEKEYNEIQNNLQKSKESTQKNSKEAREIQEELRIRLNEIAEQIEHTRKLIDNFTNDLATLKSLYSETEDLVSDVEKRLIRLESQKPGNPATLKADLTEMLKELQELKSRREALSEAIAALSEKI